MRFNQATLSYLSEVGAVLQKSEYKVTDVNFGELKAYVNKVDTYKKRNGKICKVEHQFGKWVSFPKEYVSYGQRKYTCETSDWSVADREVVTGTKTAKYLNNAAKEQIVKLYLATPPKN